MNVTSPWGKAPLGKGPEGKINIRVPDLLKRDSHWVPIVLRLLYSEIPERNFQKGR